MYSKGDSAKLEKFLLKEGNIGAVIKKKCLMHSQRCKAYDVLSRQDHRKEGKLINQVWDIVTATEVGNCKYTIEHCTDITLRKLMSPSIQMSKKPLVIQEK